jgi:hypothetical protein
MTAKFAAGAALCGVFIAASQKAHTPAQGAQYLERHGYTNVQGGDDSHWFNSCATHHTMSRTYSVTAPDGKTTTRSVCFGLFGPYPPLFDK